MYINVFFLQFCKRDNVGTNVINKIIDNIVLFSKDIEIGSTPN